MMERREFLLSGGAAVLAAGAAPAGAFAFGGAPPVRAPFKCRIIGGKAALMDLTDEIFASLAGTKFSAARAAGTGAAGRASAELVLARVERHEASAERIQFSLRFEGPAEPALPQGMYLFSHPRLGKFDLFIVPVGRSKGGVQYEAAFNRLAAKP